MKEHKGDTKRTLNIYGYIIFVVDNNIIYICMDVCTYKYNKYKYKYIVAVDDKITGI